MICDSLEINFFLPIMNYCDDEAVRDGPRSVFLSSAIFRDYISTHSLS